MAGQEELFPSREFVRGQPRTFKPLTRPLWTERKAALIARYLYYFVLITKHGTYIDAFAGRQNDRAKEGWAVECVLRNEPAWLRRYHLFEQAPGSAAELRSLAAEFSDRKITIVEGDSNTERPRALPAGSIRDRQAAFCLLDQRTFECHWATCSHVAGIKPAGYRIEQFYFLAQGWLDRALAAIRTEDGLAAVRSWWGGDDWEQFRELPSRDRAASVAERFRSELGYQEATPWPIHERGGTGRVMYYMIHASDHSEAPALMRRAYEWAVAPVPEEVDQLEIEFLG